MTEQRFSLKGGRNFDLHCVLWLPESKPKAVIQVIHGMTEHMGRYADFAAFMTENSIAVAGFDLRGHGVNPGDSRCASFGEKGWQYSLEDMHCFAEHLDSTLTDVPRFMLGFSLGSFLLREYINVYNDKIAGAVIMGTGHQPGAVLSAMVALVNSQVKKAGIDGTTPLVQKLSFDTYNSKFKPNRTTADWLCADNSELDKYIADPLCRESISAGLFRDLLMAMKGTGSATAYENVDKTVPVMLISGSDDPVGDMGKGVSAVAKAMEKAGIQDKTTLLITGARHDLLHEYAGGQAQSAMTDILQWIEKRI